MMNKKEFYENCHACGRPWRTAPRTPCECPCKYGTGEYCGKRPGCIRKKNPECPYNCVIASVTVDTADDINKLRDCFAHVANINTTFYIDDKGRPIITWAGPVELPEYDVATNPLNLRSQMLYTSVNGTNTIYYFDKTGIGHKMFEEI